MKNFVHIIMIFLWLVLASTMIKGQDKNFNHFFFNYHNSFYSLSNFIDNDEIFIYDENKKIDSLETNYEYSTDSILQKIHIVHSIPNVKNYLLLSDYIINENLAVISFTSSNRRKNITYTLKRKNSKDKWWTVISISTNSIN